MNNNNALSPEQMQALLRYAARRLGVSPEQLARTLQSDGLDGLKNALSPSDAAALEGLGEVDRARAGQLLRSPEAQQALRRLLGGQ